MSKKVLIVTGSPRAGGNSDMLAAALEKGALEAGHEILRFEAGRVSILPCKGCYACDKVGHCVFPDDFAKAAPLLKQADVIALVSPLYWYDVTAQMKLFIDKLKSFAGDIHIPESCLLMCGAVQEKERFDGAVQVYRRICEGSQQWRDRGVVIANGCAAKGAIEGHPALKEAYQLGKSL